MAKILLVEDEALTRRILVRALEREHQIVTAESLEGARDACEGFRPDIAILDWLIKGEGRGLDIVHKLRADCPETRVIIVSGLPEELIRHDLGGLDVSAILTKPVTLDDIRRVVRDSLCQ